MSSRFPLILQGSPKGWFSTMHIPNEDIGEIDPFFIGKHFNKLGRRWNLYDSDGIPHQIYFNQSLLNPLITFGWPRIRNYYRWIGIQRLTFFYYGDDAFLMVVCERRGIVRPTSFPPFHSLSTNNGDYRSFEMVMTENHVNSSKLVLSNAFSEFLSLCEYPRIRLTGPLSNIVKCKLVIDNSNNVNVKFGNGWRNFCALNHITEGNVLEFTCDGFMHTNVIIVEKI